jgi:hypothetical protein
MLLERRRSLSDFGDHVAVIERVRESERVLTQSGSELGLALDETGVTVFRPSGPQGTIGSYVRYEAGREVRTTAGGFNPYHYARSGSWVITVGDRIPTGSGGNLLHAYSLDRHLSATLQTSIPIVALRALGR